ncbi:solute carrier family 35 member F6-like isoform X2 [Ostrea edulis]|uniref:solute carrier family 35 member F6-like isoform X2 n=1 Tax=Ostrea edulis TaxID=37623 RepID=UPI002094EA2E|nr:solute carrier family 35 member F6-like isoform X2 [Ostrea edulis]
MAWTYKQIILAVMMVVTGSLNTLSTKWADKQDAVGRDGKKHSFDHPFLQAVGMFLGEFSCLIAFQIIKLYHRVRHPDREQNLGNQSFNPLIFLPAALCDMCGTSLMYIGLNLTYASSFQMLRGAVIIFTALLSVAFLGSTVRKVMWAGIFTILLGLALVGLSDILFGDKSAQTDTNGIIAGDLLIIMAQIIVAVQMVYEEKFITRYSIPAMQAVGWEGFFGVLVLGLLNIAFFYIDAGAFSKLPNQKLEDPIDAFIQIGNSSIILLATVGNIVSIAFFNFAGISVTKEISATTRMVLDSVRTLFIWLITLFVGWQHFQGLQLVGFFILLTGMCLYNNIIIVPAIKYCLERRRAVRVMTDIGGENDRLINDTSTQGANNFSDPAST